MTALYAEGLAGLEASGLGHLARHSMWLFTVANVLHVLGAALVLGAIATFDVAVLARRDGVPGLVGRYSIPLAALGVALQIPTGLVLLSAEARALGQNPAFLAKAALIGLGLANVALFHALYGRALRTAIGLPRSAAALALVSLLAWTGTLAAGRMIAYL